MLMMIWNFWELLKMNYIMIHYLMAGTKILHRAVIYHTKPYHIYSNIPHHSIPQRHSRPQSHFHSVTRWKLGSGLDDERERYDWLHRELLFHRSWAVSARQNSINICQHKYFTNTSFLRNTSLWKLLRVLKHPNYSRACALCNYSRALVPCVPVVQSNHYKYMVLIKVIAIVFFSMVKCVKSCSD